MNDIKEFFLITFFQKDKYSLGNLSDENENQISIIKLY